MSRKTKDYQKIYQKYINNSSTFEKDRINNFKEMYLQKLDDPTFDPTVEKCKLLLRSNSGVDNAFGLYVSGLLSVGIFAFGLYVSNNPKEPGILFTTIGVILIIVSLIGICTYHLLKASMHTDVWNTALIALDAALKQKNTD